MSVADRDIDGRILYVVSLNPEAGYEDKFNEWYNDEHLPELMECPGFLSATRYVAVEGEPQYLALYDIENMTAFQGERYRRLFSRPEDELTPLAREVRAHRTRGINAKYRQIHRTGAGA